MTLVVILNADNLDEGNDETIKKYLSILFNQAVLLFK